MAGALTLAKAIDVFSRELGCTEREELLDSVAAAIEFMLLNGGGEILREWKIVVRDGRFTFPRDLETPVKYKFSRLPDAGFGTVHSAYYSYSSNAVGRCCGYNDYESIQIETKANRVFSKFRPPKCGVQLLATTRDEKDVGKKIMVNGKHRGMDNAPTHFGAKTAGELLTIYHEDDNDKKYGAWIFDDITGVVKDQTCSWVMLTGLSANNNWYFLSHYHPDDEIPAFVEGELFSCPNWCDWYCDSYLHILGRIDPIARYARDEEILPVTSFEMLRLLAKRARYDEKGDFDQVAAMENRIIVLIKKQIAYQQEASNQMSFTLGSSGASITSL